MHRGAKTDSANAPAVGAGFRSGFRADLSHVDTWVFDLDNTLYPASSNLFAQIDARMTAYLSDLFDIGADEARRLQKDYYRDHGTTLNGLINVHGADPEPYLAYVHDIDLSVLPHDPDLEAGLSRLPGRKLIYTNGSTEHAARVLAHLNIARHFDDVFDIRASDFTPKPNDASYARLMARQGVVPSRAALFEDIVRNLAPARALGMTTVWVRNDSQWSKQGPSYPAHDLSVVDHVAEALSPFLLSLKTSLDV